MHYLDKAARDGVYQLSEDISEPDPAVVDLNMDLAEFDECAAATLAPLERKYEPALLNSFVLNLFISFRLRDQIYIRRSLAVHGSSPHLQLSSYPTSKL